MIIFFKKTHNITLIFSLVLLISCTFSKEYINDPYDKKEAEETLDDFYRGLKEQNEEKVSDCFYKRAIDPNNLKQFVQSMVQNESRVISRKLHHWETKTSKGLVKNSFYAFYYIEYYSDRDSLLVSVALTDDIMYAKDLSKIPKIIQYQINPKEFSQYK